MPANMPRPHALPAALRALLPAHTSTRITDGESGAAVFRLESPGGEVLYLKHADRPLADALSAEHARLQWLAGRVPVPSVRAFERRAHDAFLLTSALPGRSASACLDEAARTDPAQVPALARAIGDALRTLHAQPITDCPFDAGHKVRLAEARRRLALGAVDEDDFDDERRGWTATEVWDALTALLPLPFERVLTHGDFSLDNVFLDGGRVTGVLDVGRAGIADPYQDLAICRRDLGAFGVAAQEAMLSAYGVVVPDDARVQFHLLLDELF